MRRPFWPITDVACIDNPIAQQLLVKQLTGLGLTVIPTSNGEEAIAQWSAHEPGYFALALFDHHMPVCDGVEAAKRLRVLESRRKVPKNLLLPSALLFRLSYVYLLTHRASRCSIGRRAR